MNARIVTWLVLAVSSLLLLYGCYLVLRSFFSELFLALVLTIVFYPIYEWVVRKTNRPILAAWLCTLATALLFLLPVSALGVAIVREMSTAMAALGSAIGPSGNFEWFDRAIAFISAQVGWDAGQTKEFLRSRLSGFSSALLANAVSSIQGIGSWFLASITTLVTMFFLFCGGAGLLRQSNNWVPLPPHMIDSLLAETRRLMFANVYGVVFVSLAQGVLTGIGFWFCGLPSSIFWGAIAALFSIFPIVGSAIVWLPAVIYLASTGDLKNAGIMLAWGVLVVGMADNIIRPIVLSEGAQMNTGVMFFALLGGIEAFGLIGIFAGPIVFALAIAVIKLFRESSLALGLKSEKESIVL